MAYTSDDIILWAKISQPLSFLGETKSLSQNGAVDIDHHIKLYIERKSVEWYNSQATIDADFLYKISNWLYVLTFPYGLQAQFIDGGSGGQVAPVVPADTSGAGPDDIDWLVDATLTSQFAPLADGQRTVLLNGQNGMPDLRGYQIDFYRGGVTQNTTPLGDGSSYYSWSKATGFLQLFGQLPLNGAAQAGELMRISVDLVGSGVISTNPETIYLSTDGEYLLPDGYLISRISIKPTSADTVRIGTTLGGDEIMTDKIMTPNVYTNNGISVVDDSAMADGANLTIYFTGFTTQAQINIYLLLLES